MAKERGFQRVCLGVSVDNSHARRLYERLGYQDIALGVVECSWTTCNLDGGEQRYTEQVRYLSKAI